MKRATILFSLILIPCLCFSQDRIREIKVKDDTFIHRQTGFAFPKEISGFDREAVYAFATKRKKRPNNGFFFLLIISGLCHKSIPI